MAARKNPTQARASIGIPAEDKHEAKLSEMHDTLYALGNMIRKPFGVGSPKLMPKGLQPGESPEAKAARAHIDSLHAAMKDCKEDY